MYFCLKINCSIKNAKAKPRHWSFLAKARSHNGNRIAPIIGVLVAMIALVAVLVFAGATQAQGSGQEDSSTLGIGSSQASSDGAQLSAADRASGASENQNDAMSVSETVDLTDSSQRSITVKDPDPVVVPIAIDESNPEAVAKASEVCTLDPLPTAPRVAPDVNDGTWSSGKATAYNITTNDDGQGNFGVTDTTSGRALSENGITVAVPVSQSHLIGRIVEICYDGKVVIATVTDTGGFEKYGRSLDLAPGVYKAFGASVPDEWGVRTVYYRFL